MEFVRLGRTDALVSAVGLGCGGHSRLGLAQGATMAEAGRLVRHALDLGITLIDTAMVYGTEEAVALGLEGHDRSSVFISTKSWVGRSGAATDPVFLTPAEFVGNLDASLGRLGTDYVDLFFLHGVSASQLDYAHEVILPALRKEQEKGKVRYIGISEVFRSDTDHRMLRKALPTDAFDAVMVGFNLLNPSARDTVFPLTIANDVGTLVMFAVRRGLQNARNVREAVAGLVASGEVDPALVDPEDPLGFLSAVPEVGSLIEAAYRFCRHEPGAHVVLTGTGQASHLEENVRSILAPPLPPELQAKLRALFGRATSASAD